MSLGSLISRSIKFLEVDGLNYVESKLAAGEASLEPLVAADAPTEAAALLASAEAAVDKVFGPITGGIINTAISADAAGITAELAALMVQGATAVEGYIAKLMAAIAARAAALKAEALATK